MTNLDVWVVNVALPAIGNEFPQTSLAGLSWIITAYTVTLASLFIVAGRAGDRSGHRRLFLLGIAVFTLASLGCALAPSLPVLIVMRILQATGAAMLIPASLVLLLVSVPADRRHRAVRLWAAVGALSAASGPALGGMLIASSWRWVFIINVPIGVAVVLAGYSLLPKTVSRSQQPLPDVVGSLFLMVGVAALTGAIVQGPEWGWLSPAIVGLLLVALTTLAGFLWRCRVHPVPLIDLALFRIPTFAVASVGSIIFEIGFAIMLLSNALWCQEVWGFTALQTGLAMAPGPAVVPLVAMASNRAVRRFGAGKVSAIGCVVFAFAMLWRVVLAGATPDYLRDLLPSMLIAGTGVGLALPTLIASGSTALPGDQSSTGVAVLNTGRQLASAVGVAILVAVIGRANIGPESIGSFHAAWSGAAGFSILAAIASLRLPRATSPEPSMMRIDAAAPIGLVPE